MIVTVTDELMDYIKGLEVRVQQLEQDRLTLSTSAPNLTTFHSPPSRSDKYSNFKHTSNKKSSVENELWLQNMDDEICVYVEEPDVGDINEDDNESLLSPIVEETEADHSCDSSIGEEFTVRDSILRVTIIIPLRYIPVRSLD